MPTIKKTAPALGESFSPSEVSVVPPPAKDLLGWEAPARPFKKRNREYFTTIAAIVFLVSVILLFVKEWLLIGVIIALMFVSYVLATVEPEKVKHKITTRGVFTGDKNYKWDDLMQFWFSDKWGHEVLNIKTLRNFPPQLQMLLGSLDKKQVRDIVEKYLPYEKPEKNTLDKMANWLQEKVPLESDKK